MNPVTWIFTNWRLVLLAAGIALIGTLYGYAMHQKNRVMELEFQLAELKRLAEDYQNRSEQNARTLNEQIPVMVEQAKKTAYENFLKKYGRNAACGLSVRLPNHGASETNSSERVDASDSDSVSDPVRELAEQCSETTVIAKQFQDWAISEKLEVK